jgi:hypothetical protein
VRLRQGVCQNHGGLIAVNICYILLLVLLAIDKLPPAAKLISARHS